jgi:hypothetical protein
MKGMVKTPGKLSQAKILKQISENNAVNREKEENYRKAQLAIMKGEFDLKREEFALRKRELELPEKRIGH